MRLSSQKTTRKYIYISDLHIPVAQTTIIVYQDHPEHVILYKLDKSVSWHFKDLAPLRCLSDRSSWISIPACNQVTSYTSILMIEYHSRCLDLGTTTIEHHSDVLILVLQRLSTTQMMTNVLVWIYSPVYSRAVRILALND